MRSPGHRCAWHRVDVDRNGIHRRHGRQGRSSTSSKRARRWRSSPTATSPTASTGDVQAGKGRRCRPAGDWARGSRGAVTSPSSRDAWRACRSATASRAPADLHSQRPWARALPPSPVMSWSMRRPRPWALQRRWAEICRAAGSTAEPSCARIGDCVTSLGGMKPVDVDRNQESTSHTAALHPHRLAVPLRPLLRIPQQLARPRLQRVRIFFLPPCWCTPGLAPLTLSATALEKLGARTSPCVSWPIHLSRGAHWNTPV